MSMHSANPCICCGFLSSTACLSQPMPAMPAHDDLSQPLWAVQNLIALRDLALDANGPMSQGSCSYSCELINISIYMCLYGCQVCQPHEADQTMANHECAGSEATLTWENGLSSSTAIEVRQVAASMHRTGHPMNGIQHSGEMCWQSRERKARARVGRWGFQ